MSKVSERFLRYVQFNTQSDEDSSSVPSTSGQLLLAKALASELRELGLTEVSLDDCGYVYARLPANTLNNLPALGLIAHMDTSPDVSGAEVKAKIIREYDGGDILLNPEEQIVLKPSDFPDLLYYAGQDLIVTDGTTLLGADDKAGVAEIMTAVEHLLAHPEIPHGDIHLAFTPDEEIGQGTDHFNLENFKADFAYTIDGGPLGELEYENFNAAKAKITIKGRNVHPGSAKGKMINALLLANEFISSLPGQEIPGLTEGYEGFFHLAAMQGEVEAATLNYIIRDFDKTRFAERKQLIRKAADDLRDKYPQAGVKVDMQDQYYNMREKIEPVKHIIDTAYRAMEMVGVTPLVKPIRGGTDGARLSFEGLPTPNLFTGGHNFHGRYEFIPIPSMEKAVEVILKIIELYTE